jgi:signal transduction histidine kinase
MTSRSADEVMRLFVSIPGLANQAPESLGERMFEMAVEACAWGIVIQSNERLIYANRAALDCLLLSAAEVPGARLASVFDPDSYATLLPNLSKVSPDDDQLFMGDLKLVRRNGARLDAEVYHAGLGNGASMINFRDVTMVKRLELELRQAQKLESVGRLAAGIAHEINTPIQFIGDSATYLGSAIRELLNVLQSSRAELRRAAEAAGDSEALARLAEEDEVADLEFNEAQAPIAAARIVEGVTRVARIVAAMKAFSHPGFEAASPVDVNKVLADTLIIAGHELKNHVTVSTDFGVLPPFDGFAGDLGQAFLNLIVNGAHAIVDRRGAGGPGTIAISTRGDDDAITIQIADNGCGMPPEVEARLFEPFFTTKEVGRGTGQGLSVVRATIVQKHHGDVTVKSAVGIGTTFTLRLPLRRAA